MASAHRLRPALIAAVTLSSLAATTAAALEEAILVAPGAEAALERQLQNGSLVLRAQAAEETDPPELLAAARAEYRRLLGILYAEGHYDGVISVRVDGREAAELSPLDPPAQIRRIEITVAPGRAFTFSRAAVGPLAPETEIPEGYAEGEIARAGTIGDAAGAAVSGWRAEGHAKATLAQERIVADHAAALLSSDLTIAQGPRLTFGALRIAGNERVRTDRIRAIAGLPEGEVYDPEELRRASERLRRTGAFRSVSLRDAEEIAPGNVLPIDATLVEERPRRFGVGFEISSDQGAELSGFWLHRNLMGGAERLRFDLTVSDLGATDAANGIDYLIEGSFRRPATFTPDTDLFFSGQLLQAEEPGFTLTATELGAGVSRIFSDTLEGDVSATYRAARLEDAFGERDLQFLTIPVGLTWDTRDDPLDATTGFYVDGEVAPIIGLTNLENGGRFTLDARAYRGFGAEDRVVLAGRLQLGSLFGLEIEDAPSDYLFYAGGGGSVRGQPYRSLGTDKIGDFVVGGRSYAAISAEVRGKVTQNIGVVGFVDGGYIGAEEFYDGSGQWMTGAGLGLRYDTGFGPIRVDLATPVDGGPDDADGVELYIGIGQSF